MQMKHRRKILPVTQMFEKERVKGLAGCIEISNTRRGETGQSQPPHSRQETSEAPSCQAGFKFD